MVIVFFLVLKGMIDRMGLKIFLCVIVILFDIIVNIVGLIKNLLVFVVLLFVISLVLVLLVFRNDLIFLNWVWFVSGFMWVVGLVGLL